MASIILGWCHIPSPSPRYEISHGTRRVQGAGFEATQDTKSQENTCFTMQEPQHYCQLSKNWIFMFCFVAGMPNGLSQPCLHLVATVQALSTLWRVPPAGLCILIFAALHDMCQKFVQCTVCFLLFDFCWRRYRRHMQLLDGTTNCSQHYIQEQLIAYMTRGGFDLWRTPLQPSIQRAMMASGVPKHSAKLYRDQAIASSKYQWFQSPVTRERCFFFGCRWTQQT